MYVSKRGNQYRNWIGLDFLTTAHVLQDILAVLHKYGSLTAAYNL